jgi:aspartyl aminopeptidase
LLNSWLDRDLGVAGRLVAHDGSATLVLVDEAVARVPQLAIHLDRDITERGLILDKQVHLAPVWGIGAPSPGEFAAWIAAQAGLPPDTIATWDLCLFDRTKAQVLGSGRRSAGRRPARQPAVLLGGDRCAVCGAHRPPTAPP